MTELGPVAWPPAPIRTKRLVLRERSEEYGAEQWFGVWPSVTPSGWLMLDSNRSDFT